MVDYWVHNYLENRIRVVGNVVGWHESKSGPK